MNTTLIRQAVLTQLIIVLVISINCCIQCTSTDYSEDTRLLVRLKSLTETVNYFYGSLPQQIDLEEKCKKFALVLSMTDAIGLLYAATVEKLSVVPEDIMSRHHQNMDPKKLSVLFMSAIDKYRTSQLAPPFLELIECLKQIDEPIVEKYLDDKHLKVIIYLYQQALRSPDKQIDLHDFDLSEFHLAFLAQLGSIMRHHLKGDMHTTGQKLFQQSDKITTTARSSLAAGIDTEPSPSTNKRRRRSRFGLIKLYNDLRREQEKVLQLLQVEHMQQGLDSAESVPEPEPDLGFLAKKRRGRPPVIDEHELEERRLRRRIQARDRDRRRRQEDPLRYRELRRLRLQRSRLMNSSDSRKPERERTEQRDQPRHLRRRMQLQSQPEQVQRKQPIHRPQLDRFSIAFESPDPILPAPIIESTAWPVMSASSPLSQELQRQHQYHTQPMRASTFDELFPRHVPDRHRLAALSYSLLSTSESEWYYKQQQQPQQLILPPIFAPITHPQVASSSVAHGQTGASQIQAWIEGHLRDQGSQPQDLFLPP